MNIEKNLNKAESLPEAFFQTAESLPLAAVYRQAYLDNKESGALEKAERQWREAKYAETAQRIRSTAYYLMKIGINRGDKVAIISNSRPEWLEADLAILAAGGISVSVYQSLLAPDIAYILHDSGTSVVFAENEEQLQKLHEITSKEWTIPAVEDRPEKKVRLQFKAIITFEKTEDPDAADYEEVAAFGSSGDLPKLSRDDIASLVYTSGTTGPPKGVVQTHGNHLANLRQAFQAGMYQNDSSIMIVLPLAHSFAKLMGYICFLTPAVGIFAAVTDRRSSKVNPASVVKDISLSQATIFPLVPRMLEKMRDGIELRSAGKTPQAAILRAALKSGSSAFTFTDRIKFACAAPIRNIIKKKLFGSKLRFVISGGAKLSTDVAAFFAGLGIPVLEGYGLTETCVATNVNREGRNKIGTVGPVLAKDIEMTLSEQGEILFRGPNIARGYHARAKATKESWDEEGWFHTGDLGSIDGDGYLTITGRKKELIVTAGGKKIPPEMIEAKLKAIKFVSQAVLVGEGKPYCGALITIDLALLQSGYKDGFNEEFWKSMYSQIWKEVEELNRSLASFETVKKIEILREDFTIENGLLTPTFKVKRSAVAKKYHSIIESFYTK